MKKLLFFRRNREINLNTEFARARMARSMPGEAAALTATRFGMTV